MSLSLRKQGHRNSQMSHVPALEGQGNFEEWKRNVRRALTCRGLLHVLHDAQAGNASGQDDEGCGSSTTEASLDISTSISVIGNSCFDVPQSLPPGATSEAKQYLHATSHLAGANDRVDAASDMRAKLERKRDAECSEALLLMSQSLVGIQDWLILQGFDECEEDPARYFQGVQDVFTQYSTWTLDLTIAELQHIKVYGAPPMAIQNYQRDLQRLRQHYLRAQHPKPCDEREDKVLWWAVDGLKRWDMHLHAALARDLMEAPGSAQKLTWSRLMRQLAYITACGKSDYILEPEAIMN